LIDSINSTPRSSVYYFSQAVKLFSHSNHIFWGLFLNYSRIAIFIVSLFLFSIIAIPAAKEVHAQKKPADNATEEEKLRYFKKVLWKKAYWDQDTKLLDRLLAKEFQFCRPDGSVSTKDDELEFIRKNKPSYDSFVYTIKRLDIFENGTAIISGSGHVKGKDVKGKYEYTYISSNVLIKRHGKWKAVGSHVSGYKKVYLSKK